MKLSYIDLCGFRGYRTKLRIDFSESFTIIDGRNGVGKSTVFDAVEFALTGTIAKYGTAKADGQTVSDYLWWGGQTNTSEERYVEVGFSDGFCIRRNQLSGVVEPANFDRVFEHLCDKKNAPSSPLIQLCASSILRDEHIAALSLDLKETDRYSLLYEAIGAIDAEAWVERASNLVKSTKARVQIAEKEVETVSKEISNAARQIDDVRSTLAEESALAAAVLRLQMFIGSNLPPDELVEPTRIAIARVENKLENIVQLESMRREALEKQELLPKLGETIFLEEQKKTQVIEKLSSVLIDPKVSSTKIAQQAQELMTLVTLGQKVGLNDGHCPLCTNNQTESEFMEALAQAKEIAKGLDAQAIEYAEKEKARGEFENEITEITNNIEKHTLEIEASEKCIEDFFLAAELFSLPLDVNGSAILEHQAKVQEDLMKAKEDLRIIETLKLNTVLEKAKHNEAEAKERYVQAQAKLGLTQKSENYAQSLYKAARRAAGETLEQRLDRVLPLMSELYQRLRPHPIWKDIEYKIRGDVRRFLKLQVGEELNPQFIFSSGQRRATGLAFLLAVNLSIAWSRWETIMLDDPVQHVDDFRSVHLAEVLAQLVASGKQIICAVEDAALADLLARRLPVQQIGSAKRITLGPDIAGDLAKLNEKELAPLLPKTLF